MSEMSQPGPESTQPSTEGPTLEERANASVPDILKRQQEKAAEALAIREAQRKYQQEHGAFDNAGAKPATPPESKIADQPVPEITPNIVTGTPEAVQRFNRSDFPVQTPAEATRVSQATQPLDIKPDKGINWQMMQTQDIPIAELNRAAKEKEAANQSSWDKVKSRVSGFFNRTKS